MQKVEDGDISLNTTLPITEFEKNNSSGTLYMAEENKLQVRVLLERMIN